MNQCEIDTNWNDTKKTLSYFLDWILFFFFFIYLLKLKFFRESDDIVIHLSLEIVYAIIVEIEFKRMRQYK